MMDRFSILAPAKINLNLRIVGRRQDGYHLLKTLMVKLTLADTLELTRTNAGIDLTVQGADLAGGPENLVFRAAQAFFGAAGQHCGVRIILTKRVPVAAGLGGGSSDAAATLLGLNRMCGYPLTDQALMEIGVRLGADVPFFLYPHPVAWATGIGEVLRPGPRLAPGHFVLVNPGWPLSTSWVFGQNKLKLTNSKPDNICEGLNDWAFSWERDLGNDLQPVVLAHYPEVSRMLTAVKAAGAAQVGMSGSGPTIYGVFSGKAAADQACRQLRAISPETWWVQSVAIGG